MKRLLVPILIPIFFFPLTINAQWEIVFEEEDYSMTSFYFLDENNGFIGGQYNPDGEAVILKTIDGGESWVKVFSGTYVDQPYAIHFADENNGFAGGSQGRFLRTLDGGNTWEEIGMAFNPNNFDEVWCLDESIGFVNRGRTIDGGITWHSISPGYIHRYQFPDYNLGFAAGKYGIFKTTDQGNYWELVFSQNDDEFVSLSMLNSSAGFALTQHGELFKTSNGGNDWTSMDTIFYEAWDTIPEKIQFTTESVGYASVPFAFNTQYRLLKTIDGGQSWFTIHAKDVYSYNFQFVTKEVGYVLAEGQKLYKTTNGGGEYSDPHQVNANWIITISSNEYLHVWASAVDQKGNLYSVGIYDDTLYYNDTYLQAQSTWQYSSSFISKANSQGKVEWVIKHENQSYGKLPIAIGPDNFPVIIRSYQDSVIISKYDPTGQIAWQKTLLGKSSYNRFTIDNNGNIYMIGRAYNSLNYEGLNLAYENNLIYALKTHPDGQPVVFKQLLYGSSSTDSFLQFDKNNNLYFLARGTYKNENGQGSKGLGRVYRYDDNLNQIWIYFIDVPGGNEFMNELKIDQDNNPVVLMHEGNTSYVIKLNPEGEELFIKSFIDARSNTMGMGINENNHIFAIGSVNNFVSIDNQTIYVQSKYDYFQIDLNQDGDLASIKQAWNGCSGYTFNNYQDINYVVGRFKYDLFFENQTVSTPYIYNMFIADVNTVASGVTEKQTLKQEIKLYPNPTTGMLSLYYPDCPSNTNLIEIYNITGQKIYEISASERNSSIDLSGLKSGIYFIQISFKGKIYPEKIIIQ